MMTVRNWLPVGVSVVLLWAGPALMQSGVGQTSQQTPPLGQRPVPFGMSPEQPVQSVPSAGVGVPGGVSGGFPATLGPNGSPVAASSQDWMAFATAGSSGNQITVIDTSRQWMAVYLLEGAGKIRLVSSRPLRQDFDVQYNASAPLPEDIRRLAE